MLKRDFDRSNKWSKEFAYAVGLLASDGSLSKDGRHITFVSKDLEQVQNFCNALNIIPSLGTSRSGDYKSLTYRVQFSNVRLYHQLHNIGLMPNKSLKLSKLQVPKRYFFSFLLGYFDGDGSVYSYWDKRWRSSFMFYISFASGSKDFLKWISGVLNECLYIKGSISKKGVGHVYELRYAKSAALELIKNMYKDSDISLTRKRLKIKEILCIIGKSNHIIDKLMRK